MIARAGPFLLGLALTGCAQPQMEARPTMPKETHPMMVRAAAGPTEAVAEVLAAAERSAEGPDRDPDRLAAALMTLDASGARSDEGAVDPVPGWRASLPAGAVQPMRGRILGPAYRRGTLSAGSSVTLVQLFDGGKQARVAVATPGDGPLGIAVLDGNGKPVCPVNVSRSGACNWVPPFSARHQIVLSNPSATQSAYYLVID